MASKVTVTCGNVAVEADGQKELFETLATYQEVFSIAKCGNKKCGNKDLKFTVRMAKDEKGKEHKYYELRCLNCWAKLPFGQHDNGQTLFPKKWVRWDKENNIEVEL